MPTSRKQTCQQAAPTRMQRTCSRPGTDGHRGRESVLSTRSSGTWKSWRSQTFESALHGAVCRRSRSLGRGRASGRLAANGPVQNGVVSPRAKLRGAVRHSLAQRCESRPPTIGTAQPASRCQKRALVHILELLLELGILCGQRLQLPSIWH